MPCCYLASCLVCAAKLPKFTFSNLFSYFTLEWWLDFGSKVIISTKEECKYYAEPVLGQKLDFIGFFNRTGLKIEIGISYIKTVDEHVYNLPKYFRHTLKL